MKTPISLVCIFIDNYIWNRSFLPDQRRLASFLRSLPTFLSSFRRILRSGASRVWGLKFLTRSVFEAVKAASASSSSLFLRSLSTFLSSFRGIRQSGASRVRGLNFLTRSAFEALKAASVSLSSLFPAFFADLPQQLSADSPKCCQSRAGVELSHLLSFWCSEGSLNIFVKLPRWTVLWGLQTASNGRTWNLQVCIVLPSNPLDEDLYLEVVKLAFSLSCWVIYIESEFLL